MNATENTEKEAQESTKTNNVNNDMKNHWNTVAFRQKSRHPRKGETKEMSLPPIKEDEDLNVYFDRCWKEVGVRPAPIGPMKNIKPNSKCPCGSERKYKKCCGVGA